MSEHLTIERVKELRAAAGVPRAMIVSSGTHGIYDSRRNHIADVLCAGDAEFYFNATLVVDFLLAEIERLRALGLDLVDDRESLKAISRHKDK